MTSVFELFKIGVGPSSSHTVGPMKAASIFASRLVERGVIERVVTVEATLFGSLAFTGRGHATDKAVILGLSGVAPEGVDPDAAEALAAEVRETHRLKLAGRRAHRLRSRSELLCSIIVSRRRAIPTPSGSSARDAEGLALADETWLSIGGGFVVEEGRTTPGRSVDAPAPFSFRSGAELLARGRESGLSIADMMRANEAALRPAEAVEAMSRR